MVSVFFAAFAFFGAIVFLPRWFQVVEGFSPTNSGLAALPLMVGLIFSSIVSGLIVARTGRYKWLIVGSIAGHGLRASLLMTQLDQDTPVPVVWLWMFIAGLGVGPTFSVLTIVIQNAVPFQRARRRDLEPDVLPPDRRHGRPRVRRDDLRDGVRGQPGPPAVGGGRPATAHRWHSAGRRRRSTPVS